MSLYLVTGGAGFIGSHLCEELVRRGERVRVVDSLITGKRANLAHVPGVDFIEGDLADLAVARARGAGRGLRAAPGGHPVGAALGQRPDHVEPREHRRDAERAGRGARRRREARSSTPGPRPPTATRRRCPSARRCRPSRSRPTRCRSWWASSTCAMFTQLYGLETVTIRYFNVFGPRQDPGVAVLGRHLAVHQRAARRAPADHLRRRRADARLHLRGERRRRRAARVPRAGHRGADDQRRDRRAGSASTNCCPRCATWSACRRPPSIREARAGDVRDSQADIGLAKSLTGYTPTVDLREGLEKTLAWYRSAQPAS